MPNIYQNIVIKEDIVLIVSKTWILQMGFCHENWLNFAVEFCRIFSSIHFLSPEKKVFVHSITIIVTWGYPTSNSFLQLILFYFLLIFLLTWFFTYLCDSNRQSLNSISSEDNEKSIKYLIKSLLYENSNCLLLKCAFATSFLLNFVQESKIDVYWYRLVFFIEFWFNFKRINFNQYLKKSCTY